MSRKKKAIIVIVIVVLILGLIQALICGFEPYWFSLDGAETRHWKFLKPYEKAVRKVKKYAGVDLKALFPKEDGLSVSGFSAGNGGVVSVTINRPAIVCVFAPDQVKWDLYGRFSADVPEYVVSFNGDGHFDIYVRSLDTFAETSRVISRQIEFSDLRPDSYPPAEPIGGGYFYGDCHAVEAAYRIEYKNMAIAMEMGAIAPDQRRDALIERFDAIADGVAERLGTMDVKT